MSAIKKALKRVRFWTKILEGVEKIEEIAERLDAGISEKKDQQFVNDLIVAFGGKPKESSDNLLLEETPPKNKKIEPPVATGKGVGKRYSNEIKERARHLRKSTKLSRSAIAEQLTREYRREIPLSAVAYWTTAA